MARTYEEISQASITRVLVVGFSLVIVLIALGGTVAIHNILSIQENAAKLVEEQSVTQRLIEDLQEEQKILSQIFYTITGDPDTADPDKISKRLDRAEQNLLRIQGGAHPPAGEQVLWGELLQATHAFGAEARRLFSEPDSTPTASRDLFRKHEQVIFIISRLVDRGFGSVSQAEAEIGGGAREFNRKSLVLLGASLSLAFLCSAFTVVTTRRLVRKMAWQEDELARVSWDMLANQESIARRFSHELHDELGQTLAALKANLAAVPRTPSSVARLEDSTGLLEDSIQNVRQLSQLLRPMILDDFGLDAGLNWLCEGFGQRTGIEVNYRSNLHARLPEETETHLFRIAQEALTNVARHSGATVVEVELNAEAELSAPAGEIRLTIVDNGKGIADPGKRTQSIGMTGMRARARAAGGVFRIESPPGSGLKLEAVIPLPQPIQAAGAHSEGGI